MGRLRLLEVYDFYDGPRLFSVVSVTGALYLGFWADETAGGDEWLYVPVSARRLDEVVEGVLALRDAFLEPEDGVLFSVTMPDGGNTSALATLLSPGKVDPESLPPAGDRLRGRRVPARVTADEPIPEGTNGRLVQQLRFESKRGGLVPFGAVTSVLSRWFKFFVGSFYELGGRGDILPLAAQPGSFELTLALPRDRAATELFLELQRFVATFDEGGLVELDPEVMALDLAEFDNLVASLREHDLKLTITQQAEDPLAAPLVVELELRGQDRLFERVQGAALKVLASEDVPQADDLGRVLRVVDLLGKHSQVTSETLNVVPRQINYYKHACRVLRMIDDEAQLTPVGMQLLRLDDPTARLAALAVQFETSRCGWRWVDWSSGKSLLDVLPQSAEQFLRESTPSLSLSTAKRRARTLEAWCRALQEVHFLRFLRRPGALER